MHAIQGRLARRTPARHAGRTALALALALAAGGAQASDAWQTSGDVRFGYVGSETRARSGATTDADSIRARVRFRVRGDLGGDWHASGRVAARLDSEQDDAEFWVRTYAPGPAGLEDGQATIDEAYLEYRPAESPWSLRLGRFQAAFAIDDIMKKSLDQNDSTNFDITWTDGAWWQWRGQDWTTHVIARHNDRRGPTGALRRPLDFADGGSRAGLFVAAESKTAVGPVVQRMVTLTWLPSALRTNGLADPALEDYLAVTAKAAAEWPLGDGGTRFRLGGEIGWAPDTPRREAVNSGTGEADALSWQASFSFMDVLPDHDFGLVYGRVADGWLLSSDFRPHDELLEARWVWQASKAWQLDARIRRREEIDLPASAAGPRRDDDVYLRATWKF
ncbi:porin [Luteimonas sp. MC1572]|uniref:porin n=1 Tax=Luteimonas sp. MC1572 TaxID=2799325 RepID=UPI0018F0856C|nr:porin [Luteimonas sp. MC1572]MBJ6981854.1 porin [Luteimonas sp. MC1572]QQO03134.1 porin [Luteimonas sp. MC1572]